MARWPSGISFSSCAVSSGALRQRPRPLGRYFPEGKLLVKHQSSPIPDALAIEQGDMAPQNAAGNAEERSRLAKLHLDPNPWQKAPVGFDERATRRQIDDVCETPGAQTRSLHALGRKGAHPWRRAPFVPYRDSHVAAAKLNSRMRVRAVAPSTRTANWLPRRPCRNSVPGVDAPAGLKLSSVELPI